MVNFILIKEELGNAFLTPCLPENHEEYFKQFYCEEKPEVYYYNSDGPVDPKEILLEQNPETGV